MKNCKPIFQVIEELQSMREKNDILQSEIDYFKEEYKKLRYCKFSDVVETWN